MANTIQNILGRITGKTDMKNVFNNAFFQWLGGGFTNYDYNAKTYLEKGYNINPDVYAIINKQTVKTISVPYCIKEIDDKQAYSKLKQFDLATKGNHSTLQVMKRDSMAKKAYKEKEISFPLADPNPTQTWSDIWGLYKTYMKITGNYYLYTVSPKDGTNKGVPALVYALPSHLIQIVLKPNA